MYIGYLNKSYLYNSITKKCKFIKTRRVETVWRLKETHTLEIKLKIRKDIMEDRLLPQRDREIWSVLNSLRNTLRVV